MYLFIFLKILFMFRERKGRETNINVWLTLHMAPTGDPTRNQGMCPDWESNWRPFGSQPTCSIY